MKVFLIAALMLATHGVATFAQSSSATVGGVVYTAIYDNNVDRGCRVTGVDETCPTAVTIMSEVEISGTMSYVKRINDEAIGSVVKEIVIEPYDKGRTTFEIQNKAFFNCINLEKVTLPSDLTSISVAIFINNEKLQTIVLDRTDPSGINIAVADDLLAGRDITHYQTLMKSVKLYVPDQSVEEYKNFQAENQGSWPNKAFWSVFDVRPMSELEREDPNPGSEPEGIRIPLTDGGTVVMLDAAPGHRIQLSDDNGCVFKSATFNGYDATPYIEGNIFTIPEYSGIADFNPVFELIQSGADACFTDDLDIRISGNTVEVKSAGQPVSVEIYGISGQKVYSGNGCSVTLDCGVYILKAAGRTFKFAL